MKQQQASRSILMNGNDDIVYGRNPITEILRSGSRKIFEVYLTNDREQVLIQKFKEKKVPVTMVDMQQMDRLVPSGLHQGMAVRAERYRYGTLDEVLARDQNTRTLILALDCLQDPQNFGTLCRSALAFGVSAVILPRDRSVTVTGAVCKAASGAVEHLRIVQVTNLVRTLEDLKEKGFWIYGTSLAAGAVPLNKSSPAVKSVLVMGSEGDGLRSLVAKTCDVLITIPMQNEFDSLNVAQAGTVCLYEFTRDAPPSRPSGTLPTCTGGGQGEGCTD